MERVTPAQLRVLTKAATSGFVMASGGFSPDGAANPIYDPIYDPKFDRQRHIDNLIISKLLTWGDGANQYVLTDAARGLLSKPNRVRKESAQ